MMDDPVQTAKVLTFDGGIFVRQAVDNMGWIDLGDFGLVVDALEQTELEGEVFSAIRATLGDKPIRYVLNTHAHHDHTALNDAFGRRYGSEIVNQRTAYIEPQGRWFEGPAARVQMLPMPDCHTDEDCVVWVPGGRALFVGDIFGWGLIPCDLVHAGTTERLLSTYERLIEFDAAVVVPGHGPVCTSGHLRRWMEYLQWLRKQALMACAEGWSDRQIEQRIPPPDDMRTWWRFLQWKHQDSVAKIIQGARRGSLADWPSGLRAFPER